ncbi:MAG TPA: biotin--[acetyl-CoA-carboxylase] ligase [Verrucomicrobiales bacterium]|jgi:BirA family biotin operon repressor/biotin-[acetyl-CoA-carboxylase] ligase|nr:biotin--[acetyl-CoA-carboxylase] ligase [Verrucomicrobiales bacterium]
MSPAAQLLAALRVHPEGVAGTDLCQQLGVTRAAVWSHIELLRAAGFEIIASPHRGYQLVSKPDALLAVDLQSRLATGQVIGNVIRVLPQTTSTNDEASRAALEDHPEGLVIFAESQSAGRGRMGRRWSSPAGRGLWFSVLLRPSLAPSECTQLTAASANALVRAIQSTTGITPEIKWPNDLLIKGKKIAGILTEMSAELEHVRSVVLGIGIDVNQTASEFPADIRNIATSLKLATGKSLSRADLAEAVLHELDREYARILAGDFAAVAEEWAGYCTTLGKLATIDMGTRRVRGRAEALDENGALLLRTEHGRIERIIGGEVTLTK